MLNKVEICGISTATLPKLRHQEVEEMLVRLKNGEEDLKDEFVRCNLRLVLSVVQKFTHKRENLDDIFQIGCIGLIKAIDNFDFTYNVKFSTYAVPMIIGEIRRYLRDNSVLRVSRSLKDIAYKALKLKEMSGNEQMTNEQIALALGIDKKDVDIAIDATVEPYSLFESVYNESGENVVLLDQIKDEKSNEESWLEKIALVEAVSQLNEKEKSVVNMRYYQGKTQIEVAEEVGISQAQVSRIEKNAIERLKKHIAVCD
ncbi:MAG: sigma-70 family RNA polymerase sigma factor [Eubacteriaceae bacterium]|nr:sigma-70 family RNA polymerase sigma factor [Eubacteriaceae bacterium]